jgi:hypothetical protein
MLLQWLLILYCGAIYRSREWHRYTGVLPLAKGGALQAHLINYSNSCPASNVELNLVPNQSSKAVIVDEPWDLTNCRLDGLPTWVVAHIDPTYPHRSQSHIIWYISFNHYLYTYTTVKTVKLNFHVNTELRLSTTEQWTKTWIVSLVEQVSLHNGTDIRLS